MLFFFLLFFSILRQNKTKRHFAMSNNEGNDRALELSHYRILESGLKAYQSIQKEIDDNKEKWNALLKEKGFMGLILNDPKDVEMENGFIQIEKTLKTKLEQEMGQRRAAQLSFVEFCKKRNRDIPLNDEKYLWALKPHERLHFQTNEQ